MLNAHRIVMVSFIAIMQSYYISIAICLIKTSEREYLQMIISERYFITMFITTNGRDREEYCTNKRTSVYLLIDIISIPNSSMHTHYSQSVHVNTSISMCFIKFGWKPHISHFTLKFAHYY